LACPACGPDTYRDDFSFISFLCIKTKKRKELKNILYWFEERRNTIDNEQAELSKYISIFKKRFKCLSAQSKSHFMRGKSLLIVFISTLLTLTSINAQIVDPGAIPPDFKRQEHILIIIKPENKKTIPGFEKFIDKHFKKHYTGKYEFATEKEAESESRFQDKKIYKFCLQHKIRSGFEQKTPGSAEQVWKDHLRYNFYDRESGKEYGSFAEGRSEAETIERIAKILEGTYKYL